jgi:hypothetical protein
MQRVGFDLERCLARDARSATEEQAVALSNPRNPRHPWLLPKNWLSKTWKWLNNFEKGSTSHECDILGY